MSSMLLWGASLGFLLKASVNRSLRQPLAAGNFVR